MNKNSGFFRGVVAASAAVGAFMSAAIGACLFIKGINDNCFGDGDATHCTIFEAFSPIVAPCVTAGFAIASLVSCCCGHPRDTDNNANRSLLSA